MMIKRSTRFILFFLLALSKTAVAQTHDVFGAIAFPLSEYPQLENIVRSEADLPLLRAALYDGPNVTWETLSAYEFIRGETFDENTGELITAERFYQRLDFVTLSHTETESLDRIELYLEYPDTTLQLLDTVDNPGQRRQISALSSALSTHSRTTLINNGASANRVDILLLGDGYKKNELEKWKTDAEYIMNKFFEEEPFRSYRRYFNVHRIDVASNESGASRAGGIQRDTAFGSYFNCNNTQRLICGNTSAIYSFVDTIAAADEREIILVIANDAEYGGSGGGLTFVSTHKDAYDVALHEVAHSFGRLSDEYIYPDTEDFCQPDNLSAANVSALTDLANLNLQHHRLL